MQNAKRDKWIGWAMVTLGVVSFTYGLLTFLIVQPENSTANTLLGMFTGFGAGLLAVALVKTIRQKVVSPKKLEQEEIERNDERNVAILRTACTVGVTVAVGVMVVLAFVFMGMGLRVPSYLCLGGVYVTYISIWIAKKLLEKKM